MKMKHSLSLLALAVCAAASTSALAQSTGTLTIKGYISPVSCTPALTGANISNNILTMPDASLSELAVAGDTAKETAFSFDATACTTSAGINNMWTHFTGGTVDANGRLQTGSANLRFELVNGPGGTAIKAGGTAAGTGPVVADQGTSAPFTGSNPNRAASKVYALRYYAEAGLTAADVGAVNSSVVYTVQYH